MGNNNFSFTSSTYLDPRDGMKTANISFLKDSWANFELGPAGKARKSGAYLVPSYPVEFHCHGIGPYDFSELELLEFENINRQAHFEGIYCIPSIFLPHSKLESFVDLMVSFSQAKKRGYYSNILGISLEGPLLASFAGTPEKGNWAPTKEEWKKIASCGELGLVYTVLSPDAMTQKSYLYSSLTSSHPSLEWITSTLVEAGVKPALGHFHKGNPEESAEMISRLLAAAQKVSNHAGPEVVITDHLFNDMPNHFRHTWRTLEQKARRYQELKQARLDEWSIDTVHRIAGHVPGTLIKAAAEGLLTICLNFDGEHIDLEIARKVLELIGSKSIIAMTDRIDVPYMGGQNLQKQDGNNLWYQEKGVVAAGSYTVDRLMHNLRAIGCDEAAIWDLVSFVPLRVSGDLGRIANLSVKPFSFVSETRERIHFEASLNLAKV